jgi:hypothetical protein
MVLQPLPREGTQRNNGQPIAGRPLHCCFDESSAATFVSEMHRYAGVDEHKSLTVQAIDEL